MFAQLSLLHFIIFLLPPTLSLSLSKPGCPNLCGNLSIPFPFGVGLDCSLHSSFNINCNASTYPPKPFLSTINAEIVEINQTYVRVKYPNLVSVCYGGGAGVNVTAPSYKQSVSMNLSGTPFTLSSSNRLMAIGCDDMMLGFNEPNGVSMFVGCSVFCKSDRGGGVGYCTNNDTSLGNGCCDVSIGRATDTGFLGAQLIDMSGKLVRKRLYSCSYAFIKERNDDLNGSDVFSYPWFYLDNSTALVNDNWASATEAPVVRLDWTIIDADNCSQANMCPDKSVCVDDYYYIERGYLCSCVSGYEGNPYLPGGCKPTLGLTSVAKTECPDQCGNLSIPFPFGVGEKCYLAPSFNIHCNISSENSPKAYLVELNAEVTELSSSHVFVNYPNMGYSCYNLSDNQHRVTKTHERKLILDLSRTQYSLSDENWITAVGCHDMVEGVYGPANRSFMDSSCAAVCSDEESSDGWFWANSCWTDIPRGTTYLEAKLIDLSEQWPRTNFSCSFAFVEYKIDSSAGLITNNLTEIQHFVEEEKRLVLDWRIGAVNCKEAQRNPDYACKANSYCVDFDAAVGGYLCNCSKGYAGNPYIYSGCKDIDECRDEATNPCVSNSVCNNTPGSVICSCPKGYNGDGRKDGNGCIHEQQTKIIILIGMSSGLGFLLLLLMCLWLYKVLQKRKEKSLKAKFFKRNGGLLLRQQTSEGTLGTTKVFSANELEIATDYFNGNRIIGHGGQGTVYKGILFDGKIVAIKKSKLVEEHQLELFINEVVILSQINHRNVVKLLGCCLETEVPMLVYEFMPNGTLFDLIHDPNNEFLFPWNLRLKIAVDIAGALAYLHSASSIPIYHRDIKTDNILLDEKYVVKLSDFGISRSIVADQTHLTTMVKGTFGYLDPEYFQSSQFTEKSDVYSFGVVLVELITGQRPISLDKTNDERGLAPRFRTSMEENSLDTLLDPQVLEQSKKEEVILVARLAQRCLNLRGKMRPTMKEVATELETCRISQMSSIVDDEFEEVRIFEDMESISDDGYTWTSNYKGVSTLSSNTHPLTSTNERTVII